VWGAVRPVTSDEFPTPQNAYSGNVTTDASGKAWVTLPEYFAEINVNVKYHLTAVDDNESTSFVQVKMGREIRDNRFLIMSSAPHAKVSWRVEANRNDRWVQRHGAVVETEKPAHLRGTYLRPELYAKPDSFAEIHKRLAEAGGRNDKSRP
jgi:hypothetical protein